MGLFDNNSREYDAHQTVMNAPHKADLAHELIAAAAAYEAAKGYEEHCKSEGRPDSHAEAKAIFAGLTGGFIDRIVETKGLDYIDKQKIMHESNKAFTEDDYYSYHDRRK